METIFELGFTYWDGRFHKAVNTHNWVIRKLMVFLHSLFVNRRQYANWTKIDHRTCGNQMLKQNCFRITLYRLVVSTVTLENTQDNKKLVFFTSPRVVWSIKKLQPSVNGSELYHPQMSQRAMYWHNIGSMVVTSICCVSLYIHFILFSWLVVGSITYRGEKSSNCFIHVGSM